MSLPMYIALFLGDLPYLMGEFPRHVNFVKSLKTEFSRLSARQLQTFDY